MKLFNFAILGNSNKYTTDAEELSNNFLKHNVGPEVEILDAWKNSFNIRQQFLTNHDLNNYFETYPCLKQPFGYNLINLDFESKYPEYANNLYLNWSDTAQAVITLCKKKGYISEEDADGNIGKLFSSICLSY